MEILLTGNNGYIGTVLSELLVEKKYSVTGFDINYFETCILEPVIRNIKQIKKDIRQIDTYDVAGYDAIIHLAGLSNDPLGEFAPHLTQEINYNGTIKLAEMAKKAGVKRFIYASSQSMYGISTTKDELDEDDGEKNPITAYARTKWDAELALKKCMIRILLYPVFDLPQFLARAQGYVVISFIIIWLRGFNINKHKGQNFFIK